MSDSYKKYFLISIPENSFVRHKKEKKKPPE